MTPARNTTRKLFRAIRSIIPGLPEGIVSLQLNLDVYDFPKLQIRYHVPAAKDDDPKVETTFEIREVVSLPENPGSRRAEP